MNKLVHEIVGSEHFKRLHYIGKIATVEGQHCIIGYTTKLNCFVCDYALTEGSFQDYKDSMVYFDYCPVCGKKNEISDKLKKTAEQPKKPNLDLINPTRGLSGNLLSKVVAGLAGHRAGKLTKEEEIKIEQIQSKYDQLQKENKS